MNELRLTQTVVYYEQIQRHHMAIHVVTKEGKKRTFVLSDDHHLRWLLTGLNTFSPVHPDSPKKEIASVAKLQDGETYYLDSEEISFLWK